CKARMLSPDCRCKTFDISADGYVRSEGCIAISLISGKTQKGAKSYAWIRGCANNHVGASASLTAPNGPAQQKVIIQALRDAAVQPSDISYLETHGTGTSLGDPIEVAAFRAVYCQNKSHATPLVIGALKSIIGHTEGAAGLAGLIKLILVLKHRISPPNLHLKTLNPHIDMSDMQSSRRVIFPSKPVAFNSIGIGNDSSSLLGAISSFGFGGSNAHAIIEVPADSIFHSQFNIQNPKVESQTNIWLFTGQGSQYTDMGLEYYKENAVYRRTIDKCSEYLQQHLLLPKHGPQVITSIMYPATDEEVTNSKEYINKTVYAQIAIFCLEVSLSNVLLEEGLTPNIVLGHSLGEFAAAVVAGVMDIETGLRIVSKRSELMNSLAAEEGIMVAVKASADRISDALSTKFSHFSRCGIAADNGVDSVVISGSATEVTEILEYLNLPHKNLNVSHAFHSPLMQDAIPGMKAIINEFTLNPAKIKFASTVLGRFAEPHELQNAEYWARQLISPVLFRQALEIITNSVSPMTFFVELGPQPTLLNMAKRSFVACSRQFTGFSLIERSSARDGGIYFNNNKILTKYLALGIRAKKTIK
ncbi:MAG: acyltransferase domain-containing protein, partial [Plesiomonas sp.]